MEKYGTVFLRQTFAYTGLFVPLGVACWKAERMGERCMIDGQLLHGGDYNPEQWLEYPEILEEDVALMKEANVNCVTLGVFSWAALEPEEGTYDFGWLEEVIGRLGAEGIQTILATPSGAMPHWLTAKYPEAMQVQENGHRNRPGRRHNFCYTSPVLRQKVMEIDGELASRFGRHPSVILWHVSNELGGNSGDGACHCPLCQEAFRKWLQGRYGTLDRLNHAWWNRFWSHTYTDWGQIHSPTADGESLSPSLNLDWKRFVTDQMADFCRTETDVLRRYSSLPVTTNFMDFFKNLNYQKLHQCMDFVSWDNYPNWHSQKDEVPVAVRAAANHSLMRSLKKKPFLLMESTPTCVNWRKYNPVKRPGMHMLSSMQAIAYGSASVQYFQWRQGRGAYEKFHGAVLGHKNSSRTRAFREVAQVGRRLQKLSAPVLGTVNRPEAAIVFDWENWWALEGMTGPRLDIDYVECVLSHYQIFWEMGIDVDFISMGDALKGYRIVCAPLNYMYQEGYADRVRAYVAEGGCYVTTYFSGIADDTDLCFIGKHPLEDVLGVVQEEMDAPGKDFANWTEYRAKTYTLGTLREVVQPLEGTRALAVYGTDYCKGMPVLTSHPYHKGSCYYLAAQTGIDFLRDFYRDILEERKIDNPLGVPLPYGVTATRRRGCQNDLVFLMNFTDWEVELKGNGIWKDVESGRLYCGNIPLGGYGCLVLRPARN